MKDIQKSVDNAVPRLDKSLANDLASLWIKFTNFIFKETKSEVIQTDSAIKMTEMKQKLSKLFPPDDDITPMGQPKS